MAFEEKRKVVFEGNLVRTIREVVEREVTSDQFLDMIGKSLPFDSGPLPQGGAYLRGIPPGGGNKVLQVFLIERPASMYPVKYRMIKAGANGASRRDEENLVNLALSWPRTLWVYRFNGEILDVCYICGVEKPLLDGYREQKITTILMPNIHDSGNGQFCVGNDVAIPTTLNMGKRVVWLHNQLQGSVWNSDLTPPYPAGCGIDNLFDWHEKSLKDNEYYKKIKFPQHRQSLLGNLLDMLLMTGVGR